jgi:hypothetical protein
MDNGPGVRKDLACIVISRTTMRIKDIFRRAIACSFHQAEEKHNLKRSDAAFC